MKFQTCSQEEMNEGFAFTNVNVRNKNVAENVCVEEERKVGGEKGVFIREREFSEGFQSG